MRKIKVSSEWTDEERLAVIAELSRSIVIDVPNWNHGKMKDLANLILKLSSYTSNFLEKNRANFSEVVE